MREVRLLLHSVAAMAPAPRPDREIAVVGPLSFPPLCRNDAVSRSCPACRQEDSILHEQMQKEDMSMLRLFVSPSSL